MKALHDPVVVISQEAYHGFMAKEVLMLDPPGIMIGG